MADREDLQRQYAYHEMSNKVQKAERSRGRHREPTGEVETLRGRTDFRMGDRVATAESHKKNKPDGPPKKKPKTATPSSSAAPSGGGLVVSKGQSILDLGNLTGYQPKTEQAKAAYENLLAFMGGRNYLGNQDPQVLRDAAEEVIAILKEENMRDPERHEELSKLLTGKAAAARGKSGGLSTEAFTSLVKLGKEMDDYRQNQNTNDEEDSVNDEMGVAVVFEDSDEEGKDGNDDSDAEVDVVVDASSASENEADDADGEVDAAADSDEEEKVVQGGAETRKKARGLIDRPLSVHEIDAHFLQRQLARYFDEADVAAQRAQEVLDIIDIRSDADLRECENRLIVLLGLEVASTIQLILKNRVRVWACVTLKRANSEKERDEVQNALEKESTGEGRRVWEELHSRDRAEDWTKQRIKGMADSIKSSVEGSKDVSTAIDSLGTDTKTQYSKDGPFAMEIETDPKKNAEELDLEALAFRDGAHTMNNKSCTLPETSWRAMKKGYEEVHVPAVRTVIPKGERLVSIKELPSWTHSAFRGMDKLNRIQSKMCDVALRSSENLLLCAPTGAGKTNVACMAMLNILGQYRLEQTEEEKHDPNVKPAFDLQSFKMIYVAPMKALVQEVVKNFSDRLKDFGVTVRELSGDSSLSRQQIAETQLIVTTPEKFDIILRQGEGRAFTQLVKLVIIDEIHLLHDERGPVLESIVARVIRQVETNAEPIRLVGLSATLPNYTDVATFLRVKPDKGLFFFDHSYRPVPLQMQYIGISERNAFKRFQLQNEICYEKAMDQRKSGYQILIFVHSRAETAKTAKALRDIASERDELSSFVRDGSASQEILREEASSAVKNADLKDVLPHGFAIHHAGMAREDRELVEDLFADRHIGVLCTTATLAWGVNLPAHAVIIKGTQIYDPSKGRWAELSPLDVLQMLGRAGRPQYDNEGEGIILTQHSELQYYLSLTNMQLPVESQLIKTLPNHLNAEVSLGSVQTLNEAVDWLSYTFLYVRMLKNPESYGISEFTARDDRLLEKRRLDLVHSAATILEKCHLIQYDRKSGSLHPTPLGRVASHFYISHSSMAVYNRHMRPHMSDIELLRLFSLSGEFAHITVREEEKIELTKLAGRVPIPVKESPSEPSAKVNILLQAYISRLKLDGFALVADMAFIRQSAARIMRALFEIALRRRWSSLAKLCLDFSNMVSYRIWKSQSPLRQFSNVPEVVARKLERKSDIEWDRYQDLTASDLGELVGVPRMGRVLHKLVHEFPRLEISVQVQPITRSMLKVELALVPAFQFDVNIHGYVQEFHILVEDVNGEAILHHEVFALKSRNTEDEHVLLFTVPILEPLPPAYFIRVISDRWLHSSAVLPLSFSSLILPAKFPPPTELLDLQPLLPSAVGEPALARVFSQKEFNPIQTQTFHELFKTDRNCLVCAPPGSGKIVCAMFAIMRMLSTNADGTCVYVGPSDEVADTGFRELLKTFAPLLGKEQVLRLTGETAPDLTALVQGKIVVSSAKQWDMLSRRWKQRKAVQAVSLLVFDELQFLGGEYGPTLEVVISRARYMAGQLSEDDGPAPFRVVGLGVSIANARDVGEWMGVSTKSIFNFSPKARPFPVEIYFQSFEQSNYSARLLAMAKPVFNSLDRHIGDGTALVFVPSRRQAQLTAIDIMSYSDSHGANSYRGQNVSESDLSDVATSLREPALQQVLPSGVAFVHSGMVDSDWDTLTKLHQKKEIRVLVCPADLCWKLPCVAELIVVMGTESYDGAVGRHVDYPIVDLLHMIGSHPEGVVGKCAVLCHAPKKPYLKKLLDDPLPIESHLDSYLHDPLNSEIVTKTVGSMQDAIDYLTWTFLYRRLPKNPTYYGLRGTSNVHLSEHLSEMIETVVGDLEESRCCKISEKGDVTPLNLGMIAAYYYVQYRTLELVASSVTEKTKIRGILEILSASWEFSTLPMRFGEDKTMKTIARTLTHSLPEGSSFDANTKALVLLQCHFSRRAVSPDMRSDQQIVLKESVTLLQAIIDVISSNGWLKPALAAMELSQMVVQGLWNKDHVLKQIPHFSDEIIKRCVEHKGEDAVETVFDILTLDDDVRNELLRLPDDKMADVAVFCNNYPNIEVSYHVEDADNVSAGDPVKIYVNLEREVDEDAEEEELEELGKVSAPLFPGEKKEGWWVVVGDMSNNSLLSLKRVNLKQKTKVSLEFLAPEDAGDYDLTIFCMSDSYLGCDQEYKVPLSVSPAADSDDSDDSDDEST
eukprot:scaffold2671_cov167-Amphora_coffeaeformis.AAC.11